MELWNYYYYCYCCWHSVCEVQSVDNEKQSPPMILFCNCLLSISQNNHFSFGTNIQCWSGTQIWGSRMESRKWRQTFVWDGIELSDFVYRNMFVISLCLQHSPMWHQWRIPLNVFHLSPLLWPQRMIQLLKSGLKPWVHIEIRTEPSCIRAINIVRADGQKGKLSPLVWSRKRIYSVPYAPEIMDDKGLKRKLLVLLKCLSFPWATARHYCLFDGWPIDVSNIGLLLREHLSDS
jgi:hypothetical protein